MKIVLNDGTTIRRANILLLTYEKFYYELLLAVNKVPRHLQVKQNSISYSDIAITCTYL